MYIFVQMEMQAEAIYEDMEGEVNSTPALIRGMAACFRDLGCPVQAFVPLDRLDAFRAGMDGVLGEGACHVLSIRPQGGVEMTD